MDDAEPVPRRAEIRGSHESLAASAPSTSMHLGTGAGQQSRPGAFAHQGRGQEGFPKQARAEGLAGREGGGGYADPDDVEVNLEGQDGAWGEENDILSYVQSKVCCCFSTLSLLLFVCKTIQVNHSRFTGVIGILVQQVLQAY